MSTNSKKTTQILEPETSMVGDAFREVGHTLDNWGEKAAEASDAVINKSSKLAGQAQDELSKYGDVIVEYIQKYPTKSALIAGGVGFLLAKLLKS